jgi:hypothetical protein
LNVVIPQQPALSNDGKQWQPALGDFTSPIVKKISDIQFQIKKKLSQQKSNIFQNFVNKSVKNLSKNFQFFVKILSEFFVRILSELLSLCATVCDSGDQK